MPLKLNSDIRFRAAGDDRPCDRLGDTGPSGTVSTGVLGRGICGGGDREESLGGKDSSCEDSSGIGMLFFEMLSFVRGIGDRSAISCVEEMLGVLPAIAITKRCTSSSCSPRLPVLWWMLSIFSAMGVTIVSNRDSDLLQDVSSTHIHNIECTYLCKACIVNVIVLECICSIFRRF